MIDHRYKIVTREVARTAFRVKHFIAELSDVYIMVDGERIKAHYPEREFIGVTQTAAMHQASDALRRWLEHHHAVL